MSVESMAIALHHSRAKGAAKLVLIGIANHDGDGGAWPAVSTLAKYARVEPRSVQRALSDLESLGEIRRYISAGGDHSMADHLRPNLYRFILSCPPDCDRSKNHKTKRDAGIQGELTGLELADPVTPTSGGQLSTGVTPTSGDPVTPTSPKPSLEPLTTRASDSATVARAIQDAQKVQDAANLNAEIVRSRGRCPYSAKGHVYITNAQVCDRCGLHQGQYLDTSGEIKWRDEKSA